MHYIFKHYHQAVYMAAEHGFRFVEQFGYEVFYHANSGFRTADTLGRDSVGFHIVAKGREIEPEETLYVHPGSWRLFGPMIGDKWGYDFFTSTTGTFQTIATERDLQRFKVNLWRSPDRYHLLLRNGKPYIHPERSRAI